MGSDQLDYEAAQANADAPYALVTLETLTIKRFEHKEDWETAMANIRARGKNFVAFKYHHGAGTYVMPEIQE